MEEKPNKSHHIVVVDDQYAILEFMEDLLIFEGYTVELSSNGRKALDYLSISDADLVITDFMMPLMDGWELVQAIRALPHARTIPIIMLSASAKLPFSLSDLDAMTAFLGKPYHIEELLELIQRMLG